MHHALMSVIERLPEQKLFHLDVTCVKDGSHSFTCHVNIISCQSCSNGFDTVGLASGRASGL